MLKRSRFVEERDGLIVVTASASRASEIPQASRDLPLVAQAPCQTQTHPEERRSLLEAAAFVRDGSEVAERPRSTPPVSQLAMECEALGEALRRLDVITPPEPHPPGLGQCRGNTLTIPQIATEGERLLEELGGPFMVTPGARNVAESVERPGDPEPVSVISIELERFLVQRRCTLGVAGWPVRCMRD